MLSNKNDYKLVIKINLNKLTHFFNTITKINLNSYQNHKTVKLVFKILKHLICKI